MNVYDFDGTIYDGESTFDFYLYCVKHHPVCIKFAFIVLWSLVKYKLCLVSESELLHLAKTYISSFLKCVPDVRELAERFCEENYSKIKPFYQKLHRDDDIVVTASFGFLITPFLRRMGVNNALMSEIDLDNGSVLRLCYRKNKVMLFKEVFPNVSVSDVYTDSLNDLPLMSLAGGDVYLVKGNNISKYAYEKRKEHGQ